LIGLWGATGDGETLRERFGTAGPDAVATTLGQAIRQTRSCDAIPKAIAANRPMEKAASASL